MAITNQLVVRMGGGRWLERARGTGPAVWVGGWALAQLWLFWVAPILGAIIAGVAYRALGAEDKVMMDRVGTRAA